VAEVERAGQRTLLGHALVVLAHARLDAGAPTAATALLTRALMVADASGQQLTALRARLVCGLTARARNDLAAARGHWTVAAEGLSAIGAPEATLARTLLAS
jgi:hypothetical protein